MFVPMRLRRPVRIRFLDFGAAIVIASTATDDCLAAAITELKPLVAKSDAVAKAWQPDAVLVGIFAKLEVDGSVDSTRLAIPPNFDGGFVSVNYHSPGAMQVLSVNLMPSGEMAGSTSMPAAFGQPQVPIDANFVDMPEALAKAKALGMQAPAPGGGFLDARLTGVENVGGGPNRSLWTITPVDTSGTFPQPGQVVQLEAVGGEQTDFETASGRHERDALLRSLEAGRTFDPPLPPTFEAFQREADVCAMQWNKDLKVFEVDLRISYANQRPDMKTAEFRYFVPAPERADLRDMLNSPLLDEKSKAPLREMLATPDVFVTTVRVDRKSVKVTGFDDVRLGSGFFPRALPGGFAPLEAAMRQFWAMNLGVAPDDIRLLLFYHGLYPPDRSRPDEGFGAGGDPDDLPRDRWYWRTVAMRSERIETGGKSSTFIGDRPVVTFVHVEAFGGAGGE